LGKGHLEEDGEDRDITLTSLVFAAL